MKCAQFSQNPSMHCCTRNIDGCIAANTCWTIVHLEHMVLKHSASNIHYATKPYKSAGNLKKQRQLTRITRSGGFCLSPPAVQSL